MPQRVALSSAGIVFGLFFMIGTGCTSQVDPGAIRLPVGFRIETYAEVPNARSMALGANGTLFVGTRKAEVYAVLPGGSASGMHRVVTIARGLDSPNGVAFREGALYVAEIGRVVRYDDIEARLSNPPAPSVVNDAFPKDAHHGWKFIRFGPDGMLYVPVGAPCNVCERDDPRYASIMRMRPDGTGLEVFASGVRNTVGFDWSPETKELWFTDNGRDSMGDDIPPDELNRAPRNGLHFGFPYVHGKETWDPEFGSRGMPKNFAPPALELPAHVASLGMRFYTGTMFPSRYRGRIFIAEHGSWNRSSPVGYRVTVVRVEGSRAVSYETFAEGWRRGGKVWGRPVDVQAMPDGSLLVSDDHAGRIYRISTQPTGKEEPSAMIKVKTFTSQLKIFHTQRELEELDKAVNDFIASRGIGKVISASDASTVGSQGESIGLIRMLTYEEPSSGTREQYQEKVEDTLREWGEEIDKIRKKAEKLGTDARDRYGKQIEDLHARQDTARKKLEEMKKSGEEAWDEFRAGADKALEELKKAMEGAIEKMKRK